MNFGQYELLEMIALGGMAEVYRGRVVGAEGFEKYVAIKRIVPDLSEDDRFVKMLLTEARIHSALSHRNIVQIHDLGISEDGEYFIVLEYVEGFDLRMIMEQFSAQGEIIPEALSLHIAAEVAQGLHFAHEQRGGDGRPLGLVHRDVTPSNVLVSLAGEVKLSDFGLAKRRHDRSVIGSLKGNLAYMSPEQARQAPLDRRTDIFSLGAILFEMLTGRRLREIADEVRGWDEVAAGAVPSARSVRPELPESFERVLDQALAPEPGKRFPTAAAFSAALRALLAQMQTPVGSNDLQALLGLLTPTRQPRSPMERSKVIRLGPEGAHGANGPASRSGPEPVGPPPLPPGLALRGRQPTPAGVPGGGRRPTPMIHPVTPAPPATPTGEPPIRLGQPASPASTLRAPRKTPLQWSEGPQAPVAPRPTASPRSSGTALDPSDVPTPPPVPVPVSVTQTASWPPAPSDSTGELSPLKNRGEARPLGLWRPVAVAVAALLVLAAAVVHTAYVPLGVLFVWRRPAVLHIISEPEGAAVKLDGASLPARTPTRQAVKRDRFDHVLDVSLDGFLPVREIIRTDRSVSLSTVIVLQKDPGAVAGGLRAQRLTASPAAGAAAASAAAPARAVPDRGASKDASTGAPPTAR